MKLSKDSLHIILENVTFSYVRAYFGSDISISRKRSILDYMLRTCLACMRKQLVVDITKLAM